MDTIRVMVDESLYGDVIYELNRRGAQIVSMQGSGASISIEASADSIDLAAFKVWLARISAGAASVT